MIFIDFSSKQRHISKGFIAAISALVLTSASCSNVSRTFSDAYTDTSSDAYEQQSATEIRNDDVVLTIAVSGGDNDNVLKVVEDFNSADNGYHIEVKKYLEVYNEKGQLNNYSKEEYQLIDFQLIQDIINTDEIDIVFSNSFIDCSKYEILKEKGAFADLYQFMEDDSEVNTETLSSHILSLNETNGKLYTLPTFYMVWTLSGKTEYVGDKENWTFDEFMSHWEQMPDNATINGSLYAEDIFRVVLENNLCSFVDYENVRVNFDSPEFRDMLRFCGLFPSNNGEKMEYDYSAPNYISVCLLQGIMSANAFGGDLTLAGFPSPDGNGAYFTDMGDRFSICASSSKDRQRGAWEFIRTFSTYEYQKENAIRWVESKSGDQSYSHWESERGFCVNERAFEDIARDIIDGKYYGGTYESKGETYMISPPTQSQYNELCRYLDSVNRWDTLLDSALRDIISEEVSAYFAGKSSLSDTVNMIQDRASIWISEQT